MSRSSTKVEYNSIESLVSELLWISYLLEDLNVKLELLVTFWCDNKVAIQITENPVYLERTKHLEVDITKICNF